MIGAVALFSILLCIGILYVLFTTFLSSQDIKLRDVRLGTNAFGNELVFGTVTNTTQDEKAFVRVQIELLNDSRDVIGTTYAVKERLLPEETWSFEAQVLVDGVNSVKATILEDDAEQISNPVPLCASGACE